MPGVAARSLVFACLALHATTFTLSRQEPTIKLPPALASHHSQTADGMKLQSSTIANLQKVIEASQDGIASVVLMGDSTIAGLAGEFLDLTSWWEVYVANDRPQKYHGSEGPIEPGQDWGVDVECPTCTQKRFDVARAAVQRGKAATAKLHSQNCTWAGGIETFAMGEPLRGLLVHRWGFLPEYGEACWQSCMADAMKELKPTAIMWNVGLHLLNHRFDVATCSRRSNPAKYNCGDYQEMVHHGMSQLAFATPTLVWRTTNWVCEPKIIQHNPHLKSDLDMWQLEANRPSLEDKCKLECPKYAEKDCYNWLMNGRATELQYNQSMAAVTQAKTALRGRGEQLYVLDAFKLSRQCCENEVGCDETEDGEHYQGLDAALANELSSIMLNNLWAY